MLPEEGLSLGVMTPPGAGVEGSMLGGGVVSLGEEGSGERLGGACGSNDEGVADSRGSEVEGTAVGCSPPGQRELSGKTSQRIFIPSADITISLGAVDSLEVCDSAGRLTERLAPAAPIAKSLSKFERSRMNMLELLILCEL